MQRYYLIWTLSLGLLLAGQALGAGDKATGSAGTKPTPSTISADALINLKQNVANAEQSLQIAEEQFKNLERLQGDLRRQRRELKQTEAIATREKQSADAIQDEMKSLKSRLARIEKSIAVAAEQAHRLEEIRNEYAKTQALSQAAESRIRALLEFQQAAKKEIAALNEKEQDARQRQAELEKQYKSISRLQEDVDREKQRLTKLLTECDKQAGLKEVAVQEEQRLQNQLADLRKAMADTNRLQAVARVQAELAQAKQLQAEAQIGVQDAVKVRKTSENIVADLKGQVAEAERDLQRELKRQPSIDALRTELQKEQALLAESEAELRLHTTARTATEKEISELQLKLAAAHAAKADLERQAQAAAALSSELVRAKASRDTCRAKAEKAEQVAEKAGKDLPRLRAEVDDLAKRNMAAAGQVEALHKIRDDLAMETAQIQEAEARIQQAEKNRVVAENTASDLKRQIEDAEKQTLKTKKGKADIVQLQSALQQEQKRRLAVETKAGVLAEARSGMAKEIADLIARLDDSKQRLAETAGPDPALIRLQAALESERQARLAMEAGLERGQAMLAGAERKLTDLRAELEETDKRLARTGQKQAAAAKKIQVELDQENKLRAQAETQTSRIGLQRAGVENEIVKLKSRLAEAGQGTDGTQQLAQVVSRAQAALDQEIKLKAAAQDNAEREGKARIRADKELAEIRRQLEEKQKESAEAARQSERIEQLKTEVAQVNRERQDAESSAQASAAARATTLKELDQLKAQIALLDRQSAENEQTSGLIADLQSDLEKSRKKTSEAQSAAAAIRLEPLQKQAQELQLRLKTAEQTGAEQAGQARALAELREQLAAEHKLKETADNRTRALKQEWGRLESQIQERQDALRELEKRIAVMERDLSPKDQLQAELEKTRQAQQQAAVRLQAETNTQARLEGELTLLVGKMATLSQLADSMNSRIESGKLAQAELLQERQQRDAAAVKTKAEADARQDLENQIAGLSSKLDNLESRMQQEKKAANEADLDRKLQASLAEKAQLQKDLHQLVAQAEEQICALQARNDELQKDLQLKSQLLSESAQQDEIPADAKDVGPVDIAEGANVLAAEQRILAEAREGGGQQPPAPPSRNVVDPRAHVLTEAELHYQAGIRKWDQGDSAGAIAEFKKTLSLNPNAAGAYYNLGLIFFHQDDTATACDYAYKAGHAYLKSKNFDQAWRMAMFLKSIDSSSRLIEKLRTEITKESR